MEKLYQIGQIAKLLKVSTRTIRFYEEKGIISPAMVNAETGYRFYDENQVLKLKKILFLKDLDFSLAEIEEYLNHGKERQKQIIDDKYRIVITELDALKKIAQKNLYDLSFLENKFYYGNDVHSKNIEKVVGVWKLQGMYKNIKDAKMQKNALDYFTPYKFLAFDDKGNSPWFYHCTDKKIIFNTFYLPVSEIYQIYDNKLFLSIANPSDHNFVYDKNNNKEKHILVFEKYSDNYDDLNLFILKDTIPSKFVIDKNVVGVYKKIGTTSSLNDKMLKSLQSEIIIFYGDGTLEKYSDKEHITINWTSGIVFDKDKMRTYKYFLKDGRLFIENKTNIYKFVGTGNGYIVYNKLTF